MVKSQTFPFKLTSFYEEASRGSLKACSDCPRNPSVNETSFAFSCPDHSGTKRPLFLLVFRDPGGNDGGAALTNRLCPYCNHDTTALRVREFVDMLGVPELQVHFANAVMHGTPGENRTPHVAALNSCRKVLKGIIDILNPEVIIAFGMEASKGVSEILGFEIGHKINMQQMIGNDFYIGNKNNTHVFSLPHPAFGAVNLSRYNMSQLDAWVCVQRQLTKLKIIG